MNNEHNTGEKDRLIHRCAACCAKQRELSNFVKDISYQVLPQKHRLEIVKYTLLLNGSRSHVG